MATFKDRIVKTLRTGELTIDNGGTIGIKDYVENAYDFDFITSKDSQTIIQLESTELGESFAPELQEYYTATITIDSFSTESFLTEQFTAFKVMTADGKISAEVRIGAEVDRSFINYIPIKRLSDYSVPPNSSTSTTDMYIQNIISQLQLYFPNHVFSHTVGDSFFTVKSKLKGVGYNLSWTMDYNPTSNPDFVTSIVTLTDEQVSTDAWTDDAVISDIGEFNVAVDIYYNPELPNRQESLNYICTLGRSYNRNHFYRFDLKPVINKIIRPTYMPLYEGTLFNWVERLQTVEARPKVQIPGFSYSDVGPIKFKVLDSKLNNTTDRFIFDYLQDKFLDIDTSTLDLNQYRYSSTMRIYVDFTKYTYEQATEIQFPNYQFINADSSVEAQLVVFNNNSDSAVDYSSNNAITVLDNIENSWFNGYFEPSIASGRYETKKVVYNDKFGYFEIMIFSDIEEEIRFTYANSDINTVFPRISWINFQLYANSDRVVTKDYLFNNEVIKLKKPLNLYREEDTTYYQDNFGVQISELGGTQELLLKENNKAQVLDIYYYIDGVNLAYCTQGIVSFLGYSRPYREDFTPINADIYVKCSQALVTFENGSKSIMNVNPISEIQNIHIFGKQLLRSGDGSNLTNEGILNYSVLPLISSTYLDLNTVDENNTNSFIRAREIMFNFEYMVVDPETDTIIRNVPVSRPIKLNLIPVKKGEMVNEFVFKNSLGGHSTIAIVGELQERATSNNNVVDYYGKTIKENKYYELDNTVSTQELNLSYTPFYDSDKTVESNDVGVTYTIEYRTASKDEYKGLLDMVQSEKVYYRLYDSRFYTVGKYVEVNCRCEYDFNGNEYLLKIEFSLFDGKALQVNTLQRV